MLAAEAGRPHGLEIGDEAGGDDERLGAIYLQELQQCCGIKWRPNRLLHGEQGMRVDQRRTLGSGDHFAQQHLATGGFHHSLLLEFQTKAVQYFDGIGPSFKLASLAAESGGAATSRVE